MITLESHTTGHVTVIVVAGRLTMATVAEFSEALHRALTAGSNHLVIDLAGTTFVDSSGLGALVAGLRRTRDGGGDLRIAAPGEQASAVLSLTNLDKVLLAYPSVEAATDDW